MIRALLFLLLAPLMVLAQKTDIHRDTSFTVHSTYVKNISKYPFIKKVTPHLPEGVLTKTAVYSTIGDRELVLEIFYPKKKNKKGYPGVLLIHGGGWSSGDRSHQVPMAQQLAAKGYVTATVEYRLTPEAPYPAAVHDLKAAIRWMRANAKSYGLNPEQIASLGCSAGGQLASLIGATNGMAEFEGTGGNAKYSSAVQAVVNIDGILAFIHPDSEEGKASIAWFGGTQQEETKKWREAGALTHAGKHTPPTIFINSSIPRFHAGRDDIIKIMNTHGIYSEVHTLPDTPHPFWLLHPWFEPTLNYTAAFLDKVFKK